MEDLIPTIFSYANPEKAKVLSQFFKTGKGQYGEGDIFLGIVVPIERTIAKQFSSIALNDVATLLKHPIHECRVIALFILIEQFKKGSESKRKTIFTIYMRSTAYINNWDLVDLSAPNIVGEYVQDKDITTLYSFAKSASLWKRRISMIALFADIKRGRFDRALSIAEILVNDSHDLIQKAVGWMLREIGKRGGQKEEDIFLNKYASTMPRTMLRYAIEKFPEEKRQHFLKLR